MTKEREGSNITAVRILCLLVTALVMSCSEDKPSPGPTDRYLGTLRSAGELGDFSRLTEDGRSILPMMAPGDSMVFFQRLLVTDPDDTTGRTLEELIKPYALKINGGELYTLSGDYEYPYPNDFQAELPQRPGETIVMAIVSPDSSAVAYETVVGSSAASHTVYLTRGDSTIQLTFGDQPGFIERFSNSGKYLCLVYGSLSASLLIYDMRTGMGYRVEGDSNKFDYMPAFSADDRMMVFIRSNKKFSVGPNYFGDVWLMRFSESPPAE